MKPSVLWSARLGWPPRAERLQAKLVARLQSTLVEKNEVIAEASLVAWLGNQQVLRLETALRQGQRAQRSGSARLVARGMGKTSHSRLSRASPS
jgi:hypothetical protein